MGLRKNAKVELIKRVPLFSELGRRELNDVASIADEIDLPEGKELTVEGRPGREFLVIIEGDATVRKGGQEVNRLGTGDFFGDRSFRTLLDRSPEIENKVMSALSARLSPDDSL